MSDDAWFELLSASVDGELTPAEQQELDRQLARDPHRRELQRELASMRRRTLITTADDMPDLAEKLVTGRHAARIATGGDRSVDATRTDCVAFRAPAPPAPPQRRVKAAAVTAAAVTAAACALAVIALAALRPWPSTSSTTTAVEPEAATIVAADSAFEVSDVRVDAGAEVTWVNAGSTAHELIQQVAGASVSGRLEPDEDRTVTFDEPGVYEFHCAIHDNMSGTVTVD